MTATGAPYDGIQAKADRDIPVVVLEPGAASGAREGPMTSRRWPARRARGASYSSTTCASAALALTRSAAFLALDFEEKLSPDVAVV